MSPHTSLLSLSSLVLFLPVSLSFQTPDSNPLLSFSDQVRERHLYTENHRRGVFLEMLPDGRVRGSTAQTANSMLELRSVRTGMTVIRGVAASLYLCMDSGGHLKGQHYTEANCTFRELLLADGYSRFLSSHRGLPVSLASKRSPEQHALPFTRFLPMRSTLMPGRRAEEGVSDSEHTTGDRQRFHLDSDDPLGMALGSVLSPQFSMDNRR